MRTYFKYILSSIFSKNRSKGFTRTPKSLVSGFTLLELLVVITISTIITTALVIQNRQWNHQLTVNTQRYELALMLRQAQVYSLAVREDMAGTGDKFDIGYGVHVSVSNNNRYIFFADRNRNKKYDTGEEIEEGIKTLNRGVYISKLCAIKDGVEKCTGQPGIGALKQISVSFFRPNPAAIVSFINDGGNIINPPEHFPPATIYLRSPGGHESSIKIEANGQISTQ